jgi:hypothetical protein
VVLTRGDTRVTPNTTLIIRVISVGSVAMMVNTDGMANGLKIAVAPAMTTKLAQLIARLAVM